MKVKQVHALCYEFDITPGRPVYKVNNTSVIEKGSFHRVGYYLELQHPRYGNKWIYTEFDTFTDDPNLVGIPLQNEKYFKQKVNNMTIKTEDGETTGIADGHIEFTAYNYHPDIDGKYDAKDNLEAWHKSGHYGCMQILQGENVIWAFNAHNFDKHDLGIGNNTESEHQDWTFMQNSDEYTVKKMKIYTISNEVSFDNTRFSDVDMIGVANGDSLIYNAKTKRWGQTKIPYYKSGPPDKPNFIIALTGQSNSQGTNAWYNADEPDDQPHERIYGFNSTTKQWEIADLNTESLGSFWHKPRGWQSLGFHFARRLVEAYPDIRPGIINLGIGGNMICRWAKFNPGELWHDLNVQRATSVQAIQGDIYDMHVNKINEAFMQLEHKKIDVICWHQGESDGGDLSDAFKQYYTDCVNRVIQQYRSLAYCDEKTSFIVGETTGAFNGTNIGWEARNVELRNLEKDADAYTKCVYSADLPTSHHEYGNGDLIHFGAKAQRILGTRYFRKFRETI